MLMAMVMGNFQAFYSKTKTVPVSLITTYLHGSCHLISPFGYISTAGIMANQIKRLGSNYILHPVPAFDDFILYNLIPYLQNTAIQF